MVIVSHKTESAATFFPRKKVMHTYPADLIQLTQISACDAAAPAAARYDLERN